MEEHDLHFKEHILPDQTVFEIGHGPKKPFAFFVIDDLRLGPALGGLRFCKYDNPTNAMIDGMRLARGMTHKAAAAGLNLGGGKAVLMANGIPREPVDGKFLILAESMHEIGYALEEVNKNGLRFITAEDVGTCLGDIRRVSDTAPADALVSIYGSDNPAPATAYGVSHAILSAVAHHRGGKTDGIEEVVVAIQGVGEVGGALAGILYDQGANLIVADTDREKVGALQGRYEGIREVSPDEIIGVKADVLAPCALGQVITRDTVDSVAAQIVCGAANNQLDHPDLAYELMARGKTYVPDFVANAGGLINVDDERMAGGYNRERAFASIARIGGRVAGILEESRDSGLSSVAVADARVRRRFEAAERTPHRA